MNAMKATPRNETKRKGHDTEFHEPGRNGTVRNGGAAGTAGHGTKRKRARGSDSGRGRAPSGLRIEPFRAGSNSTKLCVRRVPPCLSACLPVCQAVCLSVCVPVSLSACPSACLPVTPKLCLQGRGSYFCSIVIPLSVRFSPQSGGRIVWSPA